MTEFPSASRPLALDAVFVMLSPAKGKLWSHANLVVAAAILVDLSRKGRLVVTGDGMHLQVGTHGATPMGDELLDDALQTIASRDDAWRVTKLVTVLPKSDRVLDRLVAEGMATEKSERKFGLVTVQRHYPTPEAAWKALRRSLQDTFMGVSTPDAQLATLFSVVDIGPNLRAGLPSEQRPEAARRAYAIRDTIGQDEAALVFTINEIVTRANNSARNSIH